MAQPDYRQNSLFRIERLVLRNVVLKGGVKSIESTCMSRVIAATAVTFVGLLTCAVQAQEESFYFGQPVQHPEGLSGVWETADGQGGAIGIHLLLDTSIPADATAPAGAPQSWQDLQLGVFDRRGPIIQRGELNYFGDSPRGGEVRFKDGRLTLHFVSTMVDAPSIDLDLVQQPGDRWVGRLHRGWFDSQVMLRRPEVDGAMGTSPIVGTWSESSSPGYTCMHIVEQAPNEFSGWSDSLKHYGELMKVRPAGDGRFSFELYAHSGVCCSHTFIGLPDAHGDRMEGLWPSGLKQAPHNGSWRKARGDSCVTESN